MVNHYKLLIKYNCLLTFSDQIATSWAAPTARKTTLSELNPYKVFRSSATYDRELHNDTLIKWVLLS